MSKDPFDNNRNNPRDQRPYENLFPIDDPFFQHFDQVRKEMDLLFSQFFDNVFFIPNNPPPSIEYRGNHTENPSLTSPNIDGRPHLSQINPNIPPPSQENNQNRIEQHTSPFFRRNTDFSSLFSHFFEPEYNTPKLSDIVPEIHEKENTPIFNDTDPHLGFKNPTIHPPRFPSPFLPHHYSAEVDIPDGNDNNDSSFRPQTYYRSQSTIITTGPNGETKKITTTQDETGQKHTTVETYNNNLTWNKQNDTNNNKNLETIFGVKPIDSTKSQENKQGGIFKILTTPFEKVKNFLWGKSNYISDSNTNDQRWNDRNLSTTTNNNNNNNSSSRGFRWSSYRDYQSKKSQNNIRNDNVGQEDNNNNNTSQDD